MNPNDKSTYISDKDTGGLEEIRPVADDDAQSAKYSVVDEQTVDNIRDDDVEAFIARHGGVQTYTEESNKRLLRRIDLHIMPLMCVTYCLQVSRPP